MIAFYETDTLGTKRAGAEYENFQKFAASLDYMEVLL